jgi:hypothetical protein
VGTGYDPVKTRVRSVHQKGLRYMTIDVAFRRESNPSQETGSTGDAGMFDNAAVAMEDGRPSAARRV